MTSRLGIELLSVFGLDPVSQVRLAADLGCGHISTGLGPAPWNPYHFAPWSLRDDPALRRETIAAMRDTGVSISLAEGFAVRPGQAMADKAGDMDLMAELGARGFGAVCMEPDAARAAGEFAALVAMAGERRMLATIEFAPCQVIATLGQAVELVRTLDQPHFRVLIDSMHFFRSGGRLDQIAALDPALIGYAQLCDVPLAPPHDDYLREAMFERLAPGEGELPLARFVAALPADIPIGLELPNLARAEAGVPLAELLRPAAEAALRLVN